MSREPTHAQLENRLNELSLLYDVARSLTSTLELPELLSRISILVAQRLKIPQFSIMLMNGDGRLEVKCAYPPGQGTEGRTFRSDEGACGRAAQTQKSVYLPDLESDADIFLPGSGARREPGALLSVPMIHQDTPLGVLNFQRPQPASFSAEEIEVLTTIADQAAIAVKNALLHEQTVALSITDPLTGIPNRRHLTKQLEMEIARASRFANQLSLLLIDIDDFKKVNDAAGHLAGDAVLQQMAATFQGMTRKVDTVVRYGGDEFVIVLPHVTKVEALEVAEKIRRTAELTAFTGGLGAWIGPITVSIGIANLPIDSLTDERLVDCADAALYAAKRNGRNRATAYLPGMELHPGRERGLDANKRSRPEAVLSHRARAAGEER
jgi:diguanylate cyclase (GGDEF)-like protein